MGSKRSWRLYISGLLLATAIALLMPSSAKAADGFNLTLSPLPINLNTNPGEPVTSPVKIQNTGNQAVKLRVSLMKFSADDSNGAPKLETPNPNDQSVKWVSFSKTSFTAQPGVINSIDVTVKPPKSAAFGYYYAVVFSQDNGSQAAVPSQNRINGAVASLILLNVNAAGEKRQLDVTSFTSRKKLYQYLPAQFDITVHNTGNIHVVPTGNIFISRPGSKDFIGTLTINDAQGNVLPKSSRTFTVVWDDGFPSYKTKRQNNQVVSDQSGQPIRELSWDLGSANKFRLGRYTASMTLVYNDGRQDVPVNGEVSFWVIPWVPFLIILVIIALVGTGIFVSLRLLLRNAKKIRKKAA